MTPNKQQWQGIKARPKWGRLADQCTTMESAIRVDRYRERQSRGGKHTKLHDIITDLQESRVEETTGFRSRGSDSLMLGHQFYF